MSFKKTNLLQPLFFPAGALPPSIQDIASEIRCLTQTQRRIGFRPARLINEQLRLPTDSIKPLMKIGVEQ